MTGRMTLLTVAFVLMAAASPAAVATPATVPADSDQATIAALRQQVAAQQQRIGQLEARAAAPALIVPASDALALSLWDRMAAKFHRMLPATRGELTWFIIGFVGEFVFFLRFVVQWWASERQKRTVVPMAFWHLSLIGTALVLAYALFRIDPVFILAYGLNIFLYVRNLMIAKRQPALAAIMEKESE